MSWFGELLLLVFHVFNVLYLRCLLYTNTNVDVDADAIYLQLLVSLKLPCRGINYGFLDEIGFRPFFP